MTHTEVKAAYHKVFYFASHVLYNKKGSEIALAGTL
jgi:hypothetical protein